MGSSNVTVLVNDVHKPHKLGYTLEYTREGVLINYTDAYVGLFQELGNNQISITPDQFKNGFTLWAFDISKGHSPGDDIDQKQTSQGSCSLKIAFNKEVLNENVTVYCMLMYHKNFVLNNLKNDYRKVEFLEKTVK